MKRLINVERQFSVKGMVLFGLLLLYGGCAVRNSTEETKHDHAKISSMLDAAVISDNPKSSFVALLDTVRSFPSVDSAWLSGSSFFVKYKHGGIVSWTVSTPIH